MNPAKRLSGEASPRRVAVSCGLLLWLVLALFLFAHRPLDLRLLIIVAGAPLVEEILFRDLLWGALARCTLLQRILLSSAAFGLAHLPWVGAPLALGIAAVGVVFGAVRASPAGLCGAMIAHGVANTALQVALAYQLGGISGLFVRLAG